MTSETLQHLAREQFRCSICLELLWSPIVVDCGHAMCFWCVGGWEGAAQLVAGPVIGSPCDSLHATLHCHGPTPRCTFRAMNNFGESTCPLCRYKFSTFASPCPSLHWAVVVCDPEAASERAVEAGVQEASTHVQMNPSVELDFLNWEGVKAASVEERISLLTRLLSCTACGAVSSAPTVLDCGHILCSTTRHLSGSPPHSCPTCGKGHTPGRRAPCTALRAVAAAVESLRPGTVSVPNDDGAQPGPGVGGEGTSGAGPSGAQEGVGSGVAPTAGGEDGKEPSSSLPAEDYAKDPITGEPFVHFGVGCDGCGLFPITGERWACMNCRDEHRFGFDLCSSCNGRWHDSGAASFSGRFLQVTGAEEGARIVLT